MSSTKFSLAIWEELQIGSALYTDHVTRQTLRQSHKDQQEAFRNLKKAIPDLISLVKSKEIRVVQGAFNSGPLFTTAFQSVAALQIALAWMDLSSAIKRVGSRLEAIQGELAKGIVAKVQGWERDGFGSHVYRFVRNEMAAHRQSHRTHFFYVWNPDTDWYQTFEERQREEPLGSNFGGYHTDLGTICLWMSRNRHVLRETTSYGTEAVFHLLIPAYCPIVTDQPIIFHQSLFPLVITGQRHQGSDFVWFNLPSIPAGLTLQYVGTFPGKESTKMLKYGVIGYYASMGTFFVGALSSALFPPCAPVFGSLIAPLLGTAGISLCTFTGGITYDVLSRENPLILGCPLLVDPQRGMEDIN